MKKLKCFAHSIPSDLHPSASINTYKDLFHCWVCDVGYNEEQFIARINGISSADAIKLLSKYQVSDNWEVQKGLLWSDPLVLTKTISLGLSKELIDEMKLGIVKDENDRKYLGIPVYYNNVLVDVRRYNIMKYENQPKMKSNEGARVGWLIPYDKFLSSNEICYLFEGEKDMLMARELGINAYTLTGGAGAVPNEYVINAFKDKDIVICYDNDDAGHKGMESVYKEIKDIVKSIKYIEIGDVVKEDMILVQFSSDAPNASLRYWTTIDEANGISTIEEYMDKMALSKEWGNRNVVKVARVKKGTEVTHAIGTAKAQTKISDPRPGNGKQILFSKFDSNWITEVRNIKE